MTLSDATTGWIIIGGLVPLLAAVALAWWMAGAVRARRWCAERGYDAVELLVGGVLVIVMLAAMPIAYLYAWSTDALIAVRHWRHGRARRDNDPGDGGGDHE